MRELIEAVKGERPEMIEIQCEESPVGEHKSNGGVEGAVQYIQAQFRTMRLGFQSRCRSKIMRDHPIMAWPIMHAAFPRNVCMVLVGEDGRTPCGRRTGKRFLRPLPEIGECIWYPKTTSEGKDRLETRWERGIFAGVREESGEL